MSIRVTVYDFFAYTIPGVFYLVVGWFGLTLFDIIDFDPTELSELPIFIYIFWLGAGYILGILLDKVAYRWLSFRYGNNRKARQKALYSFYQKYPWIELKFTPEVWGMLRRIVKINTPEVEGDIDQSNALSIMLRNISLGLFILALILTLTFIIVYTHVGNLVLAGIIFLLSLLALDRSDQRRYWFYIDILEAFTANYLIQERKLDSRIIINFESVDGIDKVNPNVKTTKRQS